MDRNLTHGLTLLCPPKVNLYLEIVRRRPDGYHDLRTLFHSISGGDRLTVWPDSRLELACDDASIPTDGTNLVLRAAEALRRETDSPREGARFLLEKTTPAGGGLGGGSANAAGALVLLNRLWGLNLPRPRLAELAASLGADVPFFLTGGAAVGEGIGEQLVPVEPLALDLVLVAPPAAVSTPWAYSLWDGNSASDASVEQFLAEARRGPDRAGGLLRNDLEPGVLAAVPDVSAARDWLMRAGALGAMMTGSGSVVFGLAEDAAHARRLAATSGAPGRVWTVRTLTAAEAALKIEPLRDQSGGA